MKLLHHVPNCPATEGFWLRNAYDTNRAYVRVVWTGAFGYEYPEYEVSFGYSRGWCLNKLWRVRVELWPVENWEGLKRELYEWVH